MSATVDCPACDFGPLRADRAQAEREARDHDREYHPEGSR